MRYIFLLFLLFSSSVFSQKIEHKAVFDCASSDMKFISSRIWLIEKSAKELKEMGVPFSFVLTIHSGCTAIVDKDSDEKIIKSIQKRLKILDREYGLEIEVCDIALRHFGYEKEELLPFIKSVKNSITRVIELQNRGYALIPYY